MELDGGSSSTQGGGYKAEVVVTIGNMMAGFLNQFSRALNAAANNPTNEISPHHLLQRKQTTVKEVIDQEHKSTIRHVYNNHNTKNNEHDCVKRFNSLNPPTFDGLAGPKAAEDWLNRIKEFLDVILAPKNIWIKFAGKKLTGCALGWFKKNNIENLKNMMQFSRRFLKVYSPEAYRRVYDRKNRLAQRHMSVKEYRIQFESNQDNFMSDETDKMYNFYIGLQPMYRRIVGDTMLNSYEELVEFTFILESQFNHIRGGKVVNLGEYFTENKKFKYYLESSEELFRSGCYFCGSVEHYRNECPRRDNQGRSRGGKKVVAKKNKKLKKKLESLGDKGGVFRSCFFCGSIEHYRNECPLGDMRRSGKKVVENLRDSLKNNNKFGNCSESSGDKGGGSRLGCFSCGSREHYRNECPLLNYHGRRRSVVNLRDSIQNNKKFRNSSESWGDEGGGSRSGCFGCGSREHYRKDCPLLDNQGQSRGGNNGKRKRANESILIDVKRRKART